MPLTQMSGHGRPENTSSLKSLLRSLLKKKGGNRVRHDREKGKGINRSLTPHRSQRTTGASISTDHVDFRWLKLTTNEGEKRRIEKKKKLGEEEGVELKVGPCCGSTAGALEAGGV